MKILVCGSREYPRLEDVWDRIAGMDWHDVLILGGARGVDQEAEAAAVFYCLEYHVFPADWTSHGRKAGYMRNLQMLDQAPDLVVAFWDGVSRGTKHTITEAERRGIPVEINRP